MFPNSCTKMSTRILEIERFAYVELVHQPAVSSSKEIRPFKKRNINCVGRPSLRTGSRRFEFHFERGNAILKEEELRHVTLRGR